MTNTFMGLGTGPYGGMNPATQGLMQLGIGLLSQNPRTQGLARGFQGAAQAYSPQAAMQRQIMQGQLEQLQRQRAQEEAYKNLYLSLPTGGAAAQAAAPSMVDPALGGGPMMAPESGTAPGQVQTAMMAPPATERPAAPSMIGNVQLPPGISPQQFMEALGPQRGMQFLAQAYQPQAAQKPYSRIGQLRADYEAGRISKQEYDQGVSAIGKAGVQVNLPKQISETESMLRAIDENMAKFAETGEERYKRMADSLQMQLAFGGKPPQNYIDARNSIGDARQGIAEVYSLIASGEADPTNLEDRANVKQSLNKARLAYANLLNRGANFTESEQAMIDSIVGGDPTDILQRVAQGDQAFLNRLQAAAESLEDRGAGLLESYLTPGIGEFEYPWQRAQQPEAQPAPSNTGNLGKLSDQDFLNAPLTEENAEEWLKEAERRGLQ